MIFFFARIWLFEKFQGGCSPHPPPPASYAYVDNTLLKSDVTSRDQVVHCRGSQELGSRFVNFACQFHRRLHSLRITLISTTLLFMRSSNV